MCVYVCVYVCVLLTRGEEKEKVWETEELCCALLCRSVVSDSFDPMDLSH